MKQMASMTGAEDWNETYDKHKGDEDWFGKRKTAMPIGTLDYNDERRKGEMIILRIGLRREEGKRIRMRRE